MVWCYGYRGEWGMDWNCMMPVSQARTVRAGPAGLNGAGMLAVDVAAAGLGFDKLG